MKSNSKLIMLIHVVIISIIMFSCVIITSLSADIFGEIMSGFIGGGIALVGVAFLIATESIIYRKS